MASQVVPRWIAQLFHVLVLVVAVLASRPALAQSDTWVVLATRDVDVSAGKLRVDVSQAKGQFKAIRLQTKGSDVTLARVVIGYHSGPQYSQERILRLVSGKPSEAIGASPDGRFLNTVDVIYAPEVRTDRPTTIDVFGLQSAEGARAVRSPVASVDASPPPPTTNQSASRQDEARAARPAPRPATAPAPVSAAPPVVAAVPAPPPAPPAAGTRGVGKAAPSVTAPAPTNPTADDKPYASVPVLFGTDRKQGETRKAKWGDSVATFGFDSQFKLALGKAVVTVPTKEGVRERGSVPRPELVVFGFRVPWGSEELDKHFTVYSAGALDEAGFLAEVKGSVAKSKSFEKHALLFVHGFNVSFEESLFRTAQMAHDLEFDGAAFMYSWPSKGDPRAYLYDEDRAKGARPYLREMLELIAAKTDVQYLHIVAHSKGADLLVEVLNGLSGMVDVKKKLRIHEIILAAPDIDRANFEQIADRIVGIAQRGVTLYASNNDRALNLSQAVRLGSVRAGEISQTLGPVLVRGIDTIDISAASTDFFGSHHITFAERLSLITDMRSILRTGTHPPDQRSAKTFSPVTTAKGLYWKYVR